MILRFIKFEIFAKRKDNQKSTFLSDRVLQIRKKIVFLSVHFEVR